MLWVMALIDSPGVEYTSSQMGITIRIHIKVAKHSFQVPMPNSPFTFKLFMLWHPYFARVEVNH